MSNQLSFEDAMLDARSEIKSQVAYRSRLAAETKTGGGRTNAGPYVPTYYTKRKDDQANAWSQYVASNFEPSYMN